MHAEADRLEHALSEELEALIDASLGFPTHDPHGDPIPSAQLELDPTPQRSLADARARRDCDGRAASRTPTADSFATSVSSVSCPVRRSRCAKQEPFGGPVVVRADGADHSDLPRALRPGSASSRRSRRVATPQRRPARRGARARSGRALRSRASRAACAGCGRSSAPPSSQPLPTSTRATSRRTSPPGRSTATCSLWVILASNLMAMLIQTLSAKLGIATGTNLAEVCRERFPRPVSSAALDSGGGDRDGHRPGGIHRRSARPAPPLRDPALSRGVDHGRVRVRDPRAAGARLPAARGGDRRVGRGDPRRLRVPGASRAAVDGGIAKGLFTPQFDDSDSVLLAVGSSARPSCRT